MSKENSRLRIPLIPVNLVATRNVNMFCFMIVFVRNIWHYRIQEVEINDVYFIYSTKNYAMPVLYCFESCKTLPIPQLAMYGCADDVGKALTIRFLQFCGVSTQSFLSKLQK